MSAHWLKFAGVVALAVGVLMASQATAQQGDDTAQAYLSTNATRQNIFLERQLSAQRELFDACMPGVSVAEFRVYFNAWLTERPRFLNRSVLLAMTSAISDRCDT